MPRRDDIHKILVLGSGPIVIGQAAEFDYSGVQACKVLLEEGYEVVLVNSNPATIMTDPEFATRTYIEPLLPGPVAKVIEREKPDALLPTLGGGTALNLARQLTERGVLEQHGVELLGANYDVIRRAEDRDLFKATMEKAGLRVPKAAAVESLAEALKALPFIGLPAIVRPGFTMGGHGGGIAYTEADFDRIARQGLDASPIGLAASPSATRLRNSSSVRAMPPPWPPIVKPGRMIAGSPTAASARSASSNTRAPGAIPCGWSRGSRSVRERGTRRPAASIVSRKSARSSARWIAS